LSYVNFLESCRKNSDICSTDENQFCQNYPFFVQTRLTSDIFFNIRNYNSLIKDTSHNKVKVIFDHFDILAKIQLFFHSIRNSKIDVIFKGG
jgi:hypothetical protein